MYEARAEHIAIGTQLYPDIEFVQVDLDKELPSAKFDIVINFGIFYHLVDPLSFLKNTAALAKEIMITEGTSSTKETFERTDDPGFDQSLNLTCTIPSKEDITLSLNDYEVTYFVEEMDDIRKREENNTLHFPFWYSPDERDIMSHLDMKRIFFFVQPKTQNNASKNSTSAWSRWLHR